MAVEHLNEENFDQIIGEKTPIIVDFWASWCGPCKMMGPVFEELSSEYEGKLTFAKLNTEEAPVAAQRNSIMSIPCLVVFKGGKEAGRIVGAKPKEMLKQEIDKII